MLQISQSRTQDISHRGRHTEAPCGGERSQEFRFQEIHLLDLLHTGQCMYILRAMTSKWYHITKASVMHP